MTNLKEAMKSPEVKYSKKKRVSLINDTCKILGYERYLMICMEEMAELSEVISQNIINKTDYLHTAEEIADVYNSIMIIQVICGIKSSKLEKVDNKKRPKKSAIFNTLSCLSKAQQHVSKYVRNTKNADERIVLALNLMNRACADAISVFKIKRKDIEKLENIKYKRLEERLNSGFFNNK